MANTRAKSKIRNVKKSYLFIFIYRPLSGAEKSTVYLLSDTQRYYIEKSHKSLSDLVGFFMFYVERLKQAIILTLSAAKHCFFVVKDKVIKVKRVMLQKRSYNITLLTFITFCLADYILVIEKGFLQNNNLL